MIKLKANSLYYAIVVAFITGLISSSYILYAYYHNKVYRKYKNETALYAALDVASSVLFTSDNFDFSLEDGITIEVDKLSWGAWNVNTIKAFNSHDTVSSTFFEGYYKPRNTYALILADNRQNLHLVGKAHIKGDVQIPKGRVEVGYIGNIRTTQSKLIDGKIESSNNALREIEIGKPPTLDKALLSDYAISFLDPGIEIHLTSPNLEVDTLKGKIKVVGDSIFISKRTYLEDVIIYGRKIVIESGFTGSIQVYATEGLELLEDVTLLYPSSLVLVKEKSNYRPQLIIGKRSVVKGIVSAHDNAKDRLGLLVSLSEESIVWGGLHIEGQLDLKGKVFGSVYANEFVANTKSSIYSNYVLNGVIDNVNYPNDILLPYWNKESKRKDVVKWLN